MQPPIWKKFVNVSGFAERNRSAIADENRRLREEESAAVRAKSGIGTVRFDLGGGVWDERDAEELEDDPVYGGIATEALFKRELKSWRDQADALDIELSDPSKPRKLTESQRAEILAEGAGLGEDNPRHAELKKALMTDEEIQAKEKAKWEAKKRLQELGQMGVNGFRQQRVQSRLSEAAKASQALAEQEQTIAAREAEGVKGRDLEAHAQEKAQVMQQKQVVETQKQSAASAILEEPNEEAKKLAEWQSMKPDQRLAKKLQDSKLFSGITQSIGIASDKSLVRRPDGSWDTPAVVKQYDNQIFNAVKSGLTAVRAKAGLRGGGTAEETQAMNEALYQFQQENNLSDEEVVRAWNDFTARNNESWQDDEKLRVLSDGEIILNASAPEILDREKLSKVIESANAPDEQKARALENLEFTRKNVAEQRLMAYEAAGVGIESPSEYAARTGRGAGMLNDPDFILEYEQKVLGAEGEVSKKARGFAGDVVLGFNKLATTVLGAGAQLTNSEMVGQLAAAGNEGGQVVGQGKPDTGIVGAVVQEAPSLAAMVVGAELIGAAGATAGVGATAMSWISRAGSLTMAGGQSLGATYADERAQGKTHEEAEEVALRSGINTAIITGVFNALPGMAGFEKYTGGAQKKVADVTMREILKSTSRQELAARVSKFARDKVLAGVSEGLEEGVDELTNAFINAEPDTNLSTAWKNAIEAAKVGALIGTAVDVVGSTGFGNREKINAAVVAAGGAEVTPEEERKLVEIAGEEVDPAVGSQHVLAMREIAEISADAPELALRASGSLKIARGMPLEELTSEEITALGVDRTGKPLGGETPAMVEMVNGRPILLDPAIRELETAAPSSKGLISMTEGEARQKFAKTKFTVTSKGGKTVEVEARNDQEAGEIAAKQFDLGDQVDTVTPLAATGGAAKGKTPTPIANTPAGAKPSQPVASQPPVTPGTTPPPSPAVAVVEKIRAKSKGMAKLITVSADPDVRAVAKEKGIFVNPAVLMAEAEAAGLDEIQTAEWIEKVIEEEVIHMAQYRAAFDLYKKSGSTETYKKWRNQYYGKIWAQDYVATGKAKIVQKLYPELFQKDAEGKERAAWEKAFEANRMYFQAKYRGNPTEQAKLWGNPPKSIIAELKAILENLLSIFEKGGMSAELQADMEYLAARLKELETAPEKPAAKPAAAAPQGPFTAGQRIEGTVHKDDAQFGGQKISGVIAQVTPSGTVLLVQADGIARPVRVMIADAKVVAVKPKEWEMFAPETGTLGIPRAEMPQIKAENRSAMVQFLKARGIDYNEETVMADTLKPTQAEYSPAKVQKARDYEGGNRAILVSEDGYVVDGHHQWLAADGDEIRVIRLMAPIQTVLDTVKEMPSVDSDKKPDRKPESKPETPSAASVPAENDSDNLSATLAFPNRAAAQEFAKAWGRHSTRGHDMSATGKDGVTRVTVYGVSDVDKQWIDSYVNPQPQAEPDIMQMSYDDLVRATYGGADARRKFSDIRPVIQSDAMAYQATNGKRTPKAVNEWLETRGVMGAVDGTVKEILAALKIVDAMTLEQAALAELNRRRNQSSTPPATTNPSEVSSSPVDDGLTPAERALRDALDGLFAAPLGSSYAANLPPDRIQPLINVAIKMIEDGKIDAQSLAESLDKIAESVGKPQSLRKYSYAIWQAFKMVDTTLEDPNWNVVYGDEDAGEPSILAEYPTVEFPVAKLKLSKDVPQFKGDANEEGVVEKLEGKYVRLGTGAILVWLRANGDFEVISGRHRFALAKSTGEKTIPAQIVREKDGFTRAMALTADAELNIRDGQGTVQDYANYFRASEIGKSDAKEKGLLGRAKGRAGWTIGTEASQEVFDLHANKRISDSVAEAIASTAPNDAALQAVGLKTAMSGAKADMIRNVMMAAKGAAAERANAGAQGDLFGFDDSAMREMENQAKVATRQQKDIREQIASVQGAAKRPEQAAKMGVDVKDPEGVNKKIAELKAELARWENWPMHSDLVAITRGQVTDTKAGNVNVAAFLADAKEKAEKHIGQISPTRLIEIQSDLAAYPYGAFMIDVPVDVLKFGNGVVPGYTTNNKAPIEVDVTNSLSGDGSKEFTVGDGNHRLNQAKKRGDKKIKAIIIPWDAKGMEAIEKLVRQIIDAPAAPTLPPSKMDIKAADSKELFADDGGFALATETTLDGDKLAAEKAKADAAKQAADAAQGNLFGDVAPDRKKDALKDVFGDLVDGLEAAPLTPSYTTPIPADRMAKMVNAAGILMAEGVNSPEKLAAELSTMFDGKLKPFTQSIWFAMKMVGAEGVAEPDWAALYAPVATAPSEPVDRKQAEEQRELEMVKAAREIVQGKGTAKEKYDQLVEAYENMPALNAKTSTSKINQAFSTPIPMAYAASIMGDLKANLSTSESSGGHASLLMEVKADNPNVYFNELNPRRLERVKTISGNWKFTNNDATTQVLPKKVKRVAGNPPFGSITLDDGTKKVFTTEMGETTTIDHAILLQDLSNMDEDGRAVFIIGGPPPLAKSEKGRREYYSKGAASRFFEHLYENYGVIDHVTVNGDLYKKQGAGWPVDIIVIQGKSKSKTALPSAKVPRMLNTWDEVFNQSQLTDNERIQSRTLTEAEVSANIRGLADDLAGIRGQRDADTDDGPRAIPDGRPTGQQGAGAGVRGGSNETTPDRPDADIAPGGQSGSDEAGTGQRPAGRPGDSNQSDARGSRQDASSKPVTKFQSKYTPFSEGNTLDTLIPSNMADAVVDAFERIKKDVGGDLVTFVKRELGYKPGEDINKHFAGEQIDALAAAIWNFERGGALIVGDQTGIGKGRIAAGLMRYAVNKGLTPVFVTEKPNLLDSMLRGDLADIDADAIVKPSILLAEMSKFEEGKKRKLPFGKKYFERVSASGKLGEGANAIFTLYSQIQADTDSAETKESREKAKRNGEAPRSGWRTAALQRLAPNAVFILDESHNAAGASITGFRMAEILAGSSRVYYSSATSAKRPENMGIYFKTNIGKVTNGSMEKLTEIMQSGGVPAMQLGSYMLARDGQYLRRERSFEGIKFETTITTDTAERDAALADNLTFALRQIVKVQERMMQVAEIVNERISKVGKGAKIPASNRTKLESANFSSKVHNVVSQYLLAIKTKAAVAESIKAVREGKKVVVGLSNTMESAIDDLRQFMNDPDTDFTMTYKGLVMRYLDKMRVMKNGKEEFVINGTPSERFKNYSTNDLFMMAVRKEGSGEDGTVSVNQEVVEEIVRRYMWDEYTAARDQVRRADLGDLPLSPIDAMRQAMEEYGVRTGEITGRTTGIDTNGEIYERSESEVKLGGVRYRDAFNDEDLDFLVINQSGSTGINLHASEKAKNKKPRKMIVVQPALDINTFMQMLGRIHRSGQVELPEFSLLQTALPAEFRPAAILAVKMAMLNANTTSNAKSDVSEGNQVTDMFNKYGDAVVYAALERDPDLQNQLAPFGSIFKKIIKDEGGMISFQEAKEVLAGQADGYIARAVTGYLAVLPVEEQQMFWDKITAEYNAMIDYLNEMGQNDLESKALELKAKTTSREVFTGGGQGDSVFEEPSYVETVETAIGKQPLTGAKAVEVAKAAKVEMRKISDDYYRDATQKIEQRIQQAKAKAVKWNAEKEAKMRGDMIENRNTIANALRMLGAMGSIKREDGSTGLAVIESVKLDPEKPFAPGSQVFTLQVNDGRRTLKISASKIKEAFEPQFESASEWDSTTFVGSTRNIVTGNLLAAIDKLKGTGQIISYTTDSGQTQMGVLLPAGFTKRVEAEKGRTRNLKTIEDFAKAFADEARVTTVDKAVKLLPVDGGVEIRVPASRSAGGKYWTKPALNALMIKGEFMQISNDMRATFPMDRLQQVIDLIGEPFVAIEKVASQDDDMDTSLQAARLTSNNDIDSPAYLGLDLQPYERPAKPDDSASDRKQAEYVALTAFEQAAEKAGGSNIEFFTLRDNATTDEDGRNDTLRRGILSFVKSFEQAFGKTVVFFDSGKSVPYGLSFPVTPNFIAINVNAPASVTYLLGHELGHVIKSQDRKLYDAFQRDVLALAKGKEGYSEMIEKRGYAADKIDDEMFNDIIGNLFARDSQLWQELAAKDTTGAFTKIAATAVRIINKMINGLRKLNQRDTTELIEDELIAVRKNIAGMLNLYRERGNSNREIVYRENATPDASPKFLKASDYDSLFAAPLAPRSVTDDVGAIRKKFVEIAKREILNDIASGDIPASVRSFEELHDYVDANEYVNDANREDRALGPYGKSKGWKTQDYIDFTNGVIDELNDWLASGDPASDSILYAANLNGMNPDRVKEAMAQQKDFGNAVKPPNRASMGDETTRKAVDVFDIEYEERRERETRKQWVEGGTERAKNNRNALIENAKANAYGEVGAVSLTPEDIVGTQIVIEQMVKEAGNDFDKLIEAGTVIQAYRKVRSDVARVLASGWDRLMKPEERNRRFLANAILTLPPKVAAQIARKQLTPEQSKIEIRRELQERLTKIEKALKEYGVTINEVLGKQVYVSLDKKNVVKDIMKDATKDEALAIRMHQQHADAAKIAKTCHMTVAEVEKLVKKVYDEALQRMIEKARAGMTLETSGLQAATLLTEEQIMAEARRMVEVGLGISPTVHTPSTRALARKAKVKVESEPEKINWSRPEFTSGLLSYTFDSKDLAEIKRTSQALIDATAATAKVETLTGKKRQEAEAMLAKLESILAKYGTSVQQVVESGKPLESYRFDITDRVHVHLIANAIRSVDADAIDKGVEWYYFSMLSGLQTMMVNASSVVHGIFDATIGRGAEMILNAFLRNPMNASLGETKYILKAMGPMMSRARSNFAASFGAEAPFFEQDILGVPPDLESVLEGHGMYHRTAISGKKGQFIRIPTRILLATDEFVKTINAMTEVGAMAYRICRAGDLKPGTKEFDDKMKELVNIPGSLAWQMAASKAYNRTFTNALPGQKDLATGETRRTRTAGEVIGEVVGNMQGLLQSGPSDTMTAKLWKTMLRLMFFPFVKVPYNITALAMTYTPLSLIDIATLYAQSRGIKGKAEKQKAQAEVIERMSRVMIGGIVAGFMLGAGEGDDDDLDKPLLITGSRPYKDTKKGVRELGQRMGVDAYSISWPLPNGKRGVFHYGRVEPIATVLATTIDTMRELKQAGRGRQGYDDAVTQSVRSFSDQLSDKTFLKGLGDAYKTWRGEQNMSKFAADKIAMAVPNLIKQPIRETDPYFRDKADTFGEELLSAIYPSGIREPKVDIYGEKSTKLGNSLTRIFDFSDAGTVAVRKVDEMLWRYQQKNPDATGIPTMASDKYTPVTGEGQKEMTEKQARMYRERAGQNLVNMLKSRTFNYTNPTERDINNLNKLIEAARKSAKSALKYDPNWN